MSLSPPTPSSRDAVFELMCRLDDPVVKGAIDLYAREIRASSDPSRFWSFNGRDSTEDLARALLDALLSMQQLRLEVLAQLSQPSFPFAYSQVATSLLQLEANLTIAASVSLSVHRRVWCAAKVHEPQLPPPPKRGRRKKADTVASGAGEKKE